ncbi:hypothetical protein EJB05_16956, partial [Eragrostis curvula]
MVRAAAGGKRPRKRRRRLRRAGLSSRAVGPDCFTHLNDDLLRSITSRLPIRSAASLSGASRHFRAQVPTLLDRVDSLTLHEPHFPKPLPDAPPLRLRRLAIAPHSAIPPSTFGPILQTAAGHGLTELSIRLSRRARVPKRVLSIRSLVVLTLDTCAVPRWSQPTVPCLRTLRLNRVAIHQEIINKIVASASCLETLDMQYCSGLGAGGCCTVESSSVKNLIFRPPLKQAEVVVRAPGLRTITLYTRAKARSLELAPAPEVRKVYLHISKPRRPMNSFRVRSFLDAATRLNLLNLRGLAIKMLSSEYKDSPNFGVVFQDIRILSVSLDFSREREAVFLLKLLESCPNLQRLTLSDVNTDEVAEANEDKADEANKDMAHETDEDMPPETDEDMAAEIDEDDVGPCFIDHEERLTNIPCLTTSLVEFSFLGFKPEEYEKSLMVCLLTKAKNLKKVGVQFEEGELAAVKEIMSVMKAPTHQRTYHKFASLYMESDYS